MLKQSSIVLLAHCKSRGRETCFSSTVLEGHQNKMPPSGSQQGGLPEGDDRLQVMSPEQLQCAPKRQRRASPEAAGADAAELGLPGLAGSVAALQSHHSQQQEASGQPEQLQGAVLEEEDRSMSRESDDSVLERCVEEQGLMEIEGEWRANDVVCGACDDGGALTAGHLHVH